MYLEVWIKTIVFKCYIYICYMTVVYTVIFIYELGFHFVSNQKQQQQQISCQLILKHSTRTKSVCFLYSKR